jgi:hypothetical protein
MLVELIAVICFVILSAGVLLGIPILVMLSSVMAVFTIMLWRTIVPTASKMFDVKIRGGMFLDVRDERRKMNLLPVRFESGYAVIDKYTKIPIDYDAVYSLDGIPVQTVWRSVGKGLRIDLMAFFDWLENEYGISVKDFEKCMEIAISLGKTFKSFGEFIDWIKELNKGVGNEVEIKTQA